MQWGPASKRPRYFNKDDIQCFTKIVRKSNSAVRTGIRICGARGHPEVRKSYIRFARWIRKEYDFPIRVPVYLLPGEEFVTVEDERAVASFFGPWDRDEEPYIRVATGDYEQLKIDRGRDAALAAMIDSLIRQIIRYHHWVRTGDIPTRVDGRKADRILSRYSEVVEHP